MKATGLVAGGLEANSSKDLLIRLTLDMLGVPYKYVTGFRSSAPARLALQRGEINFFSESSPSYFGVVEPTIVKKKEAIAVWYDPIYDGATFAPFKQMDSQGVPGFPDFHRKAQRHACRRAPCGMSIAPTSRSIPRCCARWCCRRARRRRRSMRCGARPSGSTATPEFAADAQKALQFVPHYVTGGDLNARVRRTLVVRPEIRKFVTDYIKNPPK